MKKILEKWYVSLFIIPIILTYLTTYFTLPEIFKNWQISIITSLVILVLILTYELINAKKQLKNLTPKESDKRIIQKLFKRLDLDGFHEDIYEQNAWYGYKKEMIGKTINFVYKARLVKNRVSDKKLQNLLYNLVQKLNEFHNYSSVKLFSGNDYYIPNKDNLDKNRKEIEDEVAEMNRMSKECFNELEKLIDYSKANDYM